jgi:hypothetical protein
MGLWNVVVGVVLTEQRLGDVPGAMEGAMVEDCMLHHQDQEVTRR